MESCSPALDCGVGSIVWVRRRNGSWWPGQILASDNLSASRSGTPVKLLGREDASVDWYNFEKSKRVKLFRCGEFDGCIERVESTQGMPLKKREKYARREDAILHALELERQMLKKQEKLGAPQTDVAFRAKKSRCVYLPSESSDSLDYKETLAHVDMSSSLLVGEYPYRNLLADESESAFMDDVDSDSSETVSNDSKTDSSETELDKDEGMAIFSETGHDDEEEDGEQSTSSDEHDELAISGDMPHLYPREPITCNEAVSKWQLKGKRNNRSLKSSVGASDEKGVLYGAIFEGQRSDLSHKISGPNLHYYRNDFSDAFEDTDQIFVLEDEYLTSRAVSKSQIKIHHGVDWDDWPWEDQPPLSEYWDIKGFLPVYGDHYHFDRRMRSTLVDVDLKVQASYRKEPVPIVSLMSKLDGKAIIGHPIQIEALKDGSSDILFSAIDDFGNDGIGFEGSSVLPPAWRTARRTANFRVPRPRVSSSNGAEDDADFSLDEERKIGYKKLYSGSSSHKASLSRKTSLNSHTLSIDKKSLKKVPKKVSMTSSQKTRTLSSLSIEQNLSKKPSLDSSFYDTDRLIKPEVSGLTTVACIPVELVFSRLLEKINRPPLNAALLNIGVERNT
ncbi:putative PWWP domain-containing protein [Lupinus albus]|uniref:Putative PWWP domain-containing protein n=1 Tax=Lupinus albus TaxID=3870 RepID=A0A6A4PYG3_LUPAL|nr:putative PWWP domain-containing protein [Lupinus albus]